MMRLGVCWYPEQEPRTTWRASVRQMTDLGLSVVRLGTQMWSSVEPEPNRFEWAWLDEVVGLLAAAGQEVVMATPTPSPPRWLTRQRPEVLSVGPDGRQRSPGDHHHVCLTSSVFRVEARRMTTELVERYGNHPAVGGWQLHDAIDGDGASCWCPPCQQAFRQWLKGRYGSIERLNSAWGTMVRGGSYRTFEEVDLPRSTGGQSPSLVLAHRRFVSHQVGTFVNQLSEVARRHSPGRLRIVSTDVARNDVALGDLAPRGGSPTTRAHRLVAYDHDPYEVALRHGLVRGNDEADNAWVSELQVGRWQWESGTTPAPPGALTRSCRQALYHGMHTVLLSRWRAGRFGQEQHHGGLVRHDGTPSRALDEVRGFLEELGRATEAALERPRARAAILYDCDDSWAIDAGPPVDAVPHRVLLRAAQEGASRLGIDVDVVGTDHDLSRYELILAPALHLATPERIELLEGLLDRGVTVVLGPRSLVRTEDAAWVDVAEPAGLSARLGARTTAAVEGIEMMVQPWNCSAGPWADAFVLTEHSDAEVIARYDGAELAGRPAAIRRGNLVALGPSSGEAWTQLLAELVRRVPAPAGVELFERFGTKIELDHRC